MREGRERPDCFAYRAGECSVLTEMVCRNKRCSFYKSMQKFKDDQERYRVVPGEEMQNAKCKTKNER